MTIILPVVYTLLAGAGFVLFFKIVSRGYQAQRRAVMWEGKYERAKAVGDLYREWHQNVLDEAATVRTHLFDALEQSRNLAQQLATIRVQNPGATPDDMGFTPTTPPKPYSEDLQVFLAGIMGDEARTMVEESIEMYRDGGLDDTEILRRISGTESM